MVFQGRLEGDYTLWLAAWDSTARILELVKRNGADERNRTADLLITNQLLYQLSYIGLP